MTKQSKPAVKLVGEDGNVFAIIGRVTKALNDAGQEDAAKEFKTKAFSSESYNAVLVLAGEYVEIR